MWSRDGLEMSEDRKRAVEAIPFPRSVHELRHFLDMTNYQRLFIRDMAFWLNRYRHR